MLTIVWAWRAVCAVARARTDAIWRARWWIGLPPPPCVADGELVALLGPIQGLAARAFFGALGHSEIPPRVARAMTRVDLRSVLSEFLLTLGESYDDLIAHRPNRRAAVRARLVAKLPILDRIERVCAGSALDRSALYDALRVDADAVGPLLHRFVRVAAVERALEAGDAGFGAFRSFAEAVCLRLVTWPVMSVDEVDDAFAVLNDFSIAGTTRDRLLEELDRTMAAIAEAALRVLELEVVLRGLDADRRRILHDAADGLLAPEVALAKLAGLLESARVVAERVAAPPDPAEPIDGDEDLMMRAAARLGLGPGASRAGIKRAYWRLAKACHPDKSKSPEAAEAFRQIAEAYHLLMSRTSA